MQLVATVPITFLRDTGCGSRAYWICMHNIVSLYNSPYVVVHIGNDLYR